ncbi:hypothetical protein PAMP_011693 [Pampus punctatissimus]
MVLRVILWEVQSRTPAWTLAAYKPGLTSTVPRWDSDSDARIVRSRQWCEMAPCLEGEVCSLLFNRSGWTCTRGSGRIKTVTQPRAAAADFTHAFPSSCEQEACEIASVVPCSARALLSSIIGLC